MDCDLSFFRDEVREGFYVSSMMKRYWASQLNVLEIVLEICKRNGIKIFVDYGSLLGAVRHNGYIPWDDDMDTVVFRKDIDKLLSCLKNELPEDWVVLESGNVRFLEPFYRVCNTGVFNVSDRFLEYFHGFRYPVGLDIFVLDYMPPSSEEYEVIEFLYNYIIALDEDGIPNEQDLKNLAVVQEMFNISINGANFKEIKRQLYTVAQAISASYTEVDSNILIKTDGGGYGRLKYCPEWFDDTIWMPFEYMEVPVPGRYAEILTAEYGDYMRVRKGGSSHDYPVYKKNEVEFEHITGLDFSYHPLKSLVLQQKSRNPVDCENKVIFFLPYDSLYWKYMEPAWKNAIADSRNTVFVMPIPYYEKDYRGELQEMIYNPVGYPEYVPITRLENINIEQYKIDEVYIQQPWDERNLAVSVHPYFYAPRLREMCRKLIYIPPFRLYEFDSKDNVLYKTFESFVSMPGIVYADKTVVQSDDQKRMYVDYLSIWMGEDSRDFWNAKISYDKLLTGELDCSERKADREDDRKTVMFQFDAAFVLQYREKALLKIKNVIDIMLDAKDRIKCYFSPHETIKQIIQRPDQIGMDCQRIINEISGNSEITFIDVSYAHNVLDRIDAYYGTAGALAHECNLAGKPVMLMAVID